jgi:hypothetical protein
MSSNMWNSHSITDFIIKLIFPGSITLFSVYKNVFTDYTAHVKYLLEEY